MNLLMIAPLYDNKGTVRYFLGAQIDVSSLIEDGRGLESFAQLLSQDRTELRFGGPLDRDPKQALRDLGQLLTEDEADVVRNRVQRSTMQSQPPASIRSTSTRPIPSKGGRSSRVILGMDDVAMDRLWPAASLGSSGRLPGVYQNVSDHNATPSPKPSALTDLPTVPPRPSLPLPPNHLHIPRPPDPRPPPNQTPRPNRRALHRPRRPPRRPLPRNRRHGKSHLAHHHE